MSSNIFANLNRPGTFIAEDTAGFRVPTIASFNTIYFLGSAAQGAINEPTLVSSVDDFTNIFGASHNTPAMRLLFRNDNQAKVYFTRVGIAPSFNITVDVAEAGTEIVTINGTNVSAIIGASPTVSSVRNAIMTAINLSSVGSVVEAVPEGVATVRVFARNPEASLTVTSSSDNLTVAASPPVSNPRATDYVTTLENAFDANERWEQGYLIAPEAFQTLGAASLAVGQAMENLASNKEAFDWLAVVDARSATYANVNTLQTEHLEYTSALGHIAFYAPYVIDLEGQQVPPSPAVVAIACRRNRTQGFQNPPAGVRFALKGVTDVTQKFTNQQLDVLNPTGCNIVSKMREGVVIFAARTRASLPEYRFVNARVIMSVLNGTLRNAFTSELFSVIDGRAALLNRLNESARSVCRRFWLGNALFGETEEEAFQVVCDFSNNLPEDLDEGNVTLEVYASVVPTFEKLLIRTFKVNIGQVQTAAQENN